MATNVQLAQSALFGDDGLRVSDFKLFPGTNRTKSAEQIAAEINASLERVGNGDFELIEEFAD